MRWLLYLAIAALLLGGLALFARQIGRLRYSREQAASLIEGVLCGEVSEGRWDAFTSVRQIDPRVEEARIRCAEIEDAHSVVLGNASRFTPAGATELREVVDDLRTRDD